MGVPSLFKSNFTRIAENTTKYYLELTRNYSNRFDDEVTLLATAGILDAQIYVFVEHSISMETILHIARNAVSGGQASSELSPYKMLAMEESVERFRKGKKSAADLLTGSFRNSDLMEDTLFNFVFSLEVEIFAVHSPRFSRSSLALACYGKANTISKAIRRIKEKYNSEVPFALATANLMDSPKFEAIRKQFGIRG